MFTIPPGTLLLLLLNVGISTIDYSMGGALSNELALWPIGSDQVGGVGFEPWQLVTYSFFHDTNNFFHIGLNMFGLWMFGSDVERLWGRNRYLAYYFVCVVTAGLAQLLVEFAMNSSIPTVGASGGVF